jgi:hypothetical protein
MQGLLSLAGAEGGGLSPSPLRSWLSLSPALSQTTLGALPFPRGEWGPCFIPPWDKTPAPRKPVSHSSPSPILPQGLIPLQRPLEPAFGNTVPTLGLDFVRLLRLSVWDLRHRAPQGATGGRGIGDARDRFSGHTYDGSDVVFDVSSLLARRAPHRRRRLHRKEHPVTRPLFRHSLTLGRDQVTQ